MKKLIILLLSVTIFETAFPQSGAEVTSSGRWHEWRKQWNSQFPLASWAYFSRYSGTIEEYTLYKDAGLTMVQVPLEQYSNAVAAGLKVITGGWQKLYEDQSKLDSYIIYPGAEDPSTTMYNLVDEPSPSLFAQLEQSISRIYQTDKRKAVPFITMLPNWAVPYSRFNMSYENFVQQFVDQINPAIMVHTHYPILCNGTDRPEYYQNAELFRKISLDKNVGLMGFVSLVSYQHSTNTSMCYRGASESDVYWQVYSMIAYGAQGIWYYNYRIGNETQFGEGLVLHATGQPNPSLYPNVQVVNNQLHKLAPVLMKLQSVKVSHLHNNAAQVPATTTKYTDGMITGISNISGDNFIVSEFKNQDDAQDVSPYIMLVNKRHAANTASANLQASVTITVDPAYGYVYQYNPANGDMERINCTSGKFTINLAGGHGRLVRISKQELSSNASIVAHDLTAAINKNNKLTANWSVNDKEGTCASHFEILLSGKTGNYQKIGTVLADKPKTQTNSTFFYEYSVKLNSQMGLNGILSFIFLSSFLPLMFTNRKKQVLVISLLVFFTSSLACTKKVGALENNKQLKLKVVQINNNNTQEQSPVVDVKVVNNTE